MWLPMNEIDSPGLIVGDHRAWSKDTYACVLESWLSVGDVSSFLPVQQPLQII